MSMNAFERETIIRFSDGDELVCVWTAQRRIINMIEKDGRYTITGRGEHEGTQFLSATLPIEQWSNKFGAKRKVSEEQREAMRERATLRGFGK